MSADVLERNVRLLLRRSYVPALPAPPFRDRLESLFLTEVARQSGAQRRLHALPRVTRFARPLRVAAALAAAVLALFLGWRLFTGGAPDLRAQLLARGEVALGLPDGSWRAADEMERARGLDFAPPRLVVVTPEDAGLEVRLGGRDGVGVHIVAGSVHVRPRSELELDQRGNAVVGTLRSGSAEWQRNGERVELVLGVALPLDAAPVPTTPTVTAASEPAREVIAPGASPEARAPAASVAAPARFLAGEVVSAEGMKPLTEFTVALLAERKGHETPPPLVRPFTSADGTFRWPDPPAGKQRVFVHAAGHAVRALGEHDFSGAELPALRAELEPGVSVRGSVLDAEGNPIAGAVVISENEAPTDGLFFARSEEAFWLPIRTRTGPDGRFELAHLNPGAHTLRANAEGFAPAWLDGVSVPRPAGEELAFTLGMGGIVGGTVSDDGGAPWPGAEVVIVAMGEAGRSRISFGFTRTDGDGHYRFESLPAVTMIVVTMRTEDQPEVRPIQVVEGETLRADFGVPQRGTHLHGRVLGPDGKPLVQQNVGLFDARGASWNQHWVATTTHADGGYSFEGVQPGRYLIFLIEAMGSGLRCVDELEIAPGASELEHDVKVASGRLEVTVFDAGDAEPVEYVAVIVTRVDEAGESFSAFGLTDAAGHVTVDDVRAGTYVVTAYPSQGDLGFARSERVSVAGDRPVALELVLEAGTAVDVVVRDSEGRALERAVIFHDEAGDEHLFSRLPLTDGAGRYRAVGLRPGRYDVNAHLAGHQGTPVVFECELGRELEVPIVLAPIPPR